MIFPCGPLSVVEKRKNISLEDVVGVYRNIISEYSDSPNFLFESRSINPLYGRMSLMGVDPILEISGKNNFVTVKVLQSRGQNFFEIFRDSGILREADEVVENSEFFFTLRIEKDESFLSEDQRTKRKNSALVLRKFLEFFQSEEKNLFGVYGSFSYDFIRLFETLPDLHKDTDIPDFQFFLFDTFLRFDLIKERAEVVVYREDEKSADEVLEKIGEKITNHKLQITNKEGGEETGNWKLETGEKTQKSEFVETQNFASLTNGFSTSNISCDTSKEEYEDLVRTAKDLAKRGETFEVVFSRAFQGKFSGDPFALYEVYREKNPAPYLFFFDFGESQVVGASPEMMVRVEDRMAHLRPISGTRPRGKDPISDHEYEMELLSCPKERSELDMLIDLGRNDLRRVCESGITMESYRHVEKYSRVMHTIAHLTGKLRKEYTALDAIIACLSAGTLTGAPKVQAMTEIEKYEKARRGYYGGAIGYLTFGGDMDTAIMIRTAHIRDGEFELRVGATLLYDSEPEDEYKETENKARALLEIFRNGI